MIRGVGGRGLIIVLMEGLGGLRGIGGRGGGMLGGGWRCLRLVSVFLFWVENVRQYILTQHTHTHTRFTRSACDNGKACGKWCFWNYVTGQDPTTYTAFCENLIAKHESRYQTTDSDDLGCGFTKSGVEYSVETRKQLNLKEPGQCDDHLLLYYGLKNLKADVQKSNRFIMEAAEIGNEHAMYLSAMIAIGYKGKGSHNVNWR